MIHLLVLFLELIEIKWFPLGIDVAGFLHAGSPLVGCRATTSIKAL